MAIVWLVRFAHVFFAALWVGGYLFMWLSDSVPARRLVRVQSYLGTMAMVFGFFLVDRTRGFKSFGHGEWGGIVVSAVMLATAMMACNDSGLRRATTVPAARRWALVGFLLGTLAIAFMTRAPYAR